MRGDLLRRGLGSALWGRILHTARQRGWRVLWWRSDPEAQGFYERQGARLVGWEANLLSAKPLPLFELHLS